jgi:hypothetical protein
MTGRSGFDPRRGQRIFPLTSVQTGSGAHPASCTMGAGGPFPGAKARPERNADHSPPSSAEVENEQELYLVSPQAPPWRVAGLLYLYDTLGMRLLGLDWGSTMKENMWVMNWRGCWRKRSWPNVWYYPGICLEGLSKTFQKAVINFCCYNSHASF